MGRFNLSEADDWELEDESQDVRGWTVRDATGTDLGTVTELIANTDSKRVESIVLDTGDEYPARDVELRDGVVYVEGLGEEIGTEAGPVVKTYDRARVLRNEDARAWEELSREHYNANYAGTEYDYYFYEPAYRYGYIYGASPEYQKRRFVDLENEMRRNYEEEHGEGTFEHVKEAVRHAFHRARS